MQTATLDVFYRGERNYIQGSLAMVLALQWYQTQYNPPSLKDCHVVKAAFNSLLEGPLAVAMGDDAALLDEERIKGSVELEDPQGNKQVLAILAAKQGQQPRRTSDSSSSLKSFEMTGILSSRARARHQGTFDSFLQALIEANKRCHSESFPGARDIYFLSVFDCRLPCWDEAYSEHCDFIINNRMKHKSGGQIMTVNDVAVSQENGCDLDLRLLFRFDPKECAQ